MTDSLGITARGGNVLFGQQGGTKIELTLVNQEGAESTLSRTLDYVFEANKHYKLRLSMKRVETGSQFVIDEIVNEELTVDLN